jgi:hypothetical protein
MTVRDSGWLWFFDRLNRDFTGLYQVVDSERDVEHTKDSK